MFVSKEIFDENYIKAFQKQTRHEQCHVCGMSFDTIPEEPCDRPNCPYGHPNEDDTVYEEDE